jgi:histidyl-tRNA synthetase
MSKADKIKARAPRGFADRTPADLSATERMLAAIRESYELYGFEGVETPFVEYTDSLGKFLPDQDRPNEGVFSFQDDDEQWLSLRYDLTAPLARYVAENFDALPKPYRSYRVGWVFRNEKPGPGRFRQFMQFDADTVGAASVAADAEICMMAADTMERLGLKGQYIIKVNNRKILDGLMEAIDLGGDDKANQRLTVLRALDKFDRLGESGVRALLGEKRVDESGDVTQGAGLQDWQINRLIWFVTLRSGTGAGALVPDTRNNFNPLLEISGQQEPIDMLSAMDAAYGTESQSLKGSPLFSAGIQELKDIGSILSTAGYDNKVIMDPSVVRGLEYYTGPVYEAELTFQVQDEDGRPVRFGSVGGGGRYDGLVGRFRSEPVPATGFSIGVSRLLSALQMVKSPIVSGAEKPGPVVVLVMDKDQVAAYQRMVSTLRQDGIRAELYLGSSGMKAQMKYADRRQSPCVVIQGSNERERGEVEIKDLIEGAKAAQAIASNEEWKAARPAQFSVSEDKLVEAVREVLARHFG